MKFTRLELLSSFDRLAQSVLLVTLDIEAADLRERAVAETRDQALFELLSLAFDILSAFLRSEEHTSELQSQSNLVCRLLLEKKKTKHVRHCLLTAPPSACPLTRSTRA